MILFTVFFSNLISKYLFIAVTHENPRLILSGSWGGLYMYGIVILSILIGFKIYNRLNPKKVTHIRNQWFLILISIITIASSFNTIYFFTDNYIYKFNVISKAEVTKLEYSNIESVLVSADFYFTGGGSRGGGCQLYTKVAILSKYLIVEQQSLNYAQVYDIGSILKEKNITPNVSYTNNCRLIPEDRKAVIENAFNVKL